MPPRPRTGDAPAGLAVFALAYAAYALTAFPGVPGGDSGELAAAALSMGIPHPTGYPLYMLAARLWLWVFPVGEAAYRLTALSALCAAASAAVLYLLHRGLGRGAALAGALALLYAYSPGVWGQGIAAEVYAFQSLLGALYLLALLRWARGAGQAWLLAAALLAGAQLAHHLTSVFLVAAGGLVVLGRRREVDWGRLWWRTALLAALPLALYGYLVARSLADPPVDSGNPETLAALVRHVTGARYQAKLFPVHATEVAANARFLAGALREDFPLLLALPALAGVVLGALRGGAFGAGIAALALLHGAFCLLYRVTDLGAFVPPLLLALNLGLGEAAARLGALPRIAALRLHPGVAAGLLAAAVAGLAARNAPRMDPGPAFAASAHAADLLDSLPFGAQLVAEGDFSIHPLLYAQVVEQRRTDVAVFAGDPTIFQGYGNRSMGTRRLFYSSPEVVVRLGGRPPREHGFLQVSSVSDAPPGPDPAAVYRPLPEDAELRRQGRQDAMALTLLIGRLNRRWEAARAAGDVAAAGRLAGEIVAESEAYLRLVVPREEQYRAMVETATRLERWDLIVRWTERLAAVSALDPRAANNLAYAYLRTGGDLRRAETLARAAVAGRPDIPPFLYTLSEVLAAAGRREEAAQVYQRARAAEGPGGTGR